MVSVYVNTFKNYYKTLDELMNDIKIHGLNGIS